MGEVPLYEKLTCCVYGTNSSTFAQNRAELVGPEQTRYGDRGRVPHRQHYDAGCSQVDVLRMRYKSDNFGAEKGVVSPNW